MDNNDSTAIRYNSTARVRPTVYHSHAPEQTRKFASQLASSCTSGTIFFLEGEMGCGKTIFAQGVADHCSVNGLLQSPSFFVMQEYEESSPGFVHIDAYRLQSKKDSPGLLYDIEDCLIRNAEGMIVVEWASRFPKTLSHNDFFPVHCQFSYEDETSRIITIHHES